jgi:hypothetical protein
LTASSSSPFLSNPSDPLNPSAQLPLL